MLIKNVLFPPLKTFKGTINKSRKKHYLKLKCLFNIILGRISMNHYIISKGITKKSIFYRLIEYDSKQIT